MILAHPFLEHMITFDGSTVKLLIIESTEYRSRFLEELSGQICGGVGRFRIYEKKELDICKSAKLIFDPFRLSCNEKDIASGILDHLKKMALDEYHYVQASDFLSKVGEYVNQLASELDVNILADSPKIGDLIKTCSPEYVEDCSSLLERICNYLDCIFSYTNVKLCIFVNLNDYLSCENLQLLQKHVAYHKYNVLRIESKYNKDEGHCDVHIIDESLCEIVSTQ